jgi:hypothetical protein
LIWTTLPAIMILAADRQVPDMEGYGDGHFRGALIIPCKSVLVIKQARLFGASLRLTPSGLSRNIAPGDVFKARIARNSWLLRRFATQSLDFLVRQ